MPKAGHEVVFDTHDFAVLDRYAAKLSSWLERRPRSITWLNDDAGVTFTAYVDDSPSNLET